MLIDLLPPIAACFAYRNIPVSASSWMQGAIKTISIALLLTTFTNVKPAFLKSKPNPPILQPPMSMFDLDYLLRNLRLEYEWLQFVSLTNP
jgi:hypothetical protein